MKVEAKLFGLLVPFFAVVGAIYAWFTYHGMHGTEWVGVVGLALTAMLCAFLAFYLWHTGRRLDLRPDDNPDGEIAEQAGEYGFFSPHSWWPMALGLSCALIFLGVAIGWWLVFIGLPFAALALVGWTFEYFHGDHAI